MPSDFYDAMSAAGLSPPDYVKPGVMHRFPGSGKVRNNRDAWCILFPDQQGGVFGDWSSGLKECWHATPNKAITEEERKQRQRKAAKAIAKAENDRLLIQEETARKAEKIWLQASQASVEHAYLAKKSINPHGIRCHKNCLVIPLTDGNSISSLQFIMPDGNKRFLTGGRTQGRYFIIGSPGRLMYLCEGYATAASIHVATGDAVAIAFTASNLTSVATQLSKSFPDTRIVIAGDNDQSGVGQKFAMETGRIVGCSVAVPPELGDWNDYSVKHGLDNTRIQLQQSASLRLTDGASILDAIYNFLQRFIAYPDLHCLVAHTLWIAHTHLMESFESTPRLAFLSPEPASGKTRALEISVLLVPNPVEAVNVTPAYLFRKVGDEGRKPTILYDEIDTVFGPRAKGNEEIRGLLNAGHRKGAVAGRCVTTANTVRTEEIPAYSAVAMAGLGSLPDTILSRSIVIRMRKRSPSEKVEPYRRRLHQADGSKLNEMLTEWCNQITQEVSNAYPSLPDQIQDRDADVWEPLLAIADAARGHWPQSARLAAVTLTTLAKESTPSLGVQLLSNLRQVFGQKAGMFTTTILNELNGNEDWPWGNFHGSPLNPRGLAELLRQYGVQRTTIRVDNKPGKGYLASDLHEPWTRYTLTSPSSNSVTGVTTVTRPTPICMTVTDVSNVTDPGNDREADHQNLTDAIC